MSPRLHHQPFTPHAIEVHRVGRSQRRRLRLVWFGLGFLCGQLLSVAALVITRGLP